MTIGFRKNPFKTFESEPKPDHFAPVSLAALGRLAQKEGRFTLEVLKIAACAARFGQVAIREIGRSELEVLRGVKEEIIFGDKTLVMRRLTPDDYEAIRDLYNSMSPDDTCNRFMLPVHRPGDHYVKSLQQAEVAPEQFGIFDGGTLVAECAAAPCGGIADVAYVVAAGYRGRENPDQPRLGKILFTHVLDVIAANKLVRGVHADVSSENIASIGILEEMLRKHPAFGSPTEIRAFPEAPGIEICASRS